MSTSSSIRRAVRCALVASAAAATMSALPAAAQDNTISEIVVTGSRIASRDAVADTPIMTVDQEAMINSGYTTVDHYINTLPQVTPNISSQSNNPSLNGRAHLDLRGLGISRNLVLVNHRRGMGSGTIGVVDVNTIPAALIERVEVITGGAAATYGPDAVAGVTNFILKDSFDGVALRSSYNITEEGDGEEWGADLTFGGAFADDRGNAVFNAGYFKREDLYKGARQFSASASNTTGTLPGGSWVPGANQPTQAAVDALFGPGACARNGGAAGFGFNPDGSLFCTGVENDPRNVVGYTGPESDIAQRFYPDRFSYEFEPDNILVLPMERWSLYTHIDYEMTSFFKPYASAQFTNYNALQELAATPAGGTTGFTIPVTNPFVPAQLAAILAQRPDNPATTTVNETTAPFAFDKRFNSLGGRTGYNTHDVWQLTFGTEGDITDTWSYDIYYSYGRSVQNEAQGGNVRRDRVQELLNAADGGASLCAGGLNLFGSASISQACEDRISLEAKNLTTVEQNVIEGQVSGDLFKLPMGTVQAAIGASYRDIMVDFRPDAGLQPGLVAGFNQQLPVSGKLEWTDVFGEVSIPLLSEMPGIQYLGLTLGARTTDNNISGSDETWKATLDWTVTDWARFRGGVQKAVRAPNINELFSPQLNNFPTFTGQDPCNTTGSIAAQYRNGPNGAQIQALCAAQSVVAGGAGYNQPSGQANGITGGNPDLTPEQADSFTLGFVMQSPWEGDMLSRLSLSIDYWSINLEDVIASVEAATIAQRCYNRDGANPTFSAANEWCQLFRRDPNNGGVIELSQLQRNQAFIETSGIDLTFNWGFGLGGAGDLGLSLIGTYVEKYETQTTEVDPVYDLAGSIGATTGSSTPEWRGTFIMSYSYEDLRVQATTRYIDEMIHANVVRGGVATATNNTGVEATYYVDLTGTYDLTENVTLRLGVNNLTNQEPRLYTPNVQANTDPSLYDVLGRRYFVGFEMRM